jgi:hypothetical protein
LARCRAVTATTRAARVSSGVEKFRARAINYLDQPPSAHFKPIVDPAYAFDALSKDLGQLL